MQSGWNGLGDKWHKPTWRIAIQYYTSSTIHSVPTSNLWLGNGGVAEKHGIVLNVGASQVQQPGHVVKGGKDGTVTARLHHALPDVHHLKGIKFPTWNIRHFKTL